MKTILVLNCGSSSIKYKLFNSKMRVVVHGLVEKIGEEGSRILHWKGIKRMAVNININNHKQGIQELLKIILNKEWGGIKNISDISIVGHRVVHGGEMSKTVFASKKTLNRVKKYEALAPLHNPHNLTGIKECMRIMRGTPQAMVFDTAFHQTMPKKAFMYGLPYEYYAQLGIRKYGFHGTSHKYVYEQVRKLLRKRKCNVITCHLGAGSSITAIKKGISVDTSMGLTPLEGVMMATRTGDLDPAIVQHLIRNCKMSIDEIFYVMNHKSGLLGISGVSRDVRVIEEKAKKGNKRCKLSLQMFSYRVAKYIAAYSAVLGDVDAIAFAGGIGENDWKIREDICKYLNIIGVKIDRTKNKKSKTLISAKNSKIKVFAIHTDEEVMIAKEALNALRKR